ncbi:hypothetical protein HS99_0040085 [Kitasatospora aureofaciens]|uniref:RNA polymerase sigma-70 region 2 domain-containing protein n=1 Tax=Kitasatospora aureofaciens TaxID=1894 RepID=A0A1E7MVW2_KITAU|nr:hypothetical protein HS99_0040085 [Kitasatospora aureofaciens]
MDGLFTYCLSVLCEHDAATAALHEVRELARRHGARLAEPGLVRAWLFSLARYCCLRRLADGTVGEAGSGTEPGAGPGAELTEAEAVRRRRELASLAWPEAAGTDPEQREALELSVRHRLTPLEVAAVLGLPFDRTRGLLAAAEAEVARTRAALLVLGVGSCPELDRLGGAGTESWRDWVLGPALRRELVQHVVDCPTCRGTAERVAAGEAAEGAAGLSGLPLLTAPSPAGGDASGAARRVGGVASGAAAGAAWVSAAGAAGLRFDHGGFPRHRVPDAGRGLAVRRRVVTTGVLAAVLAAPVVALWAGHRGGAGPGSAASVSAVRVDEAGRDTGQRPPWAVGGAGADAAGGRGCRGWSWRVRVPGVGASRVARVARVARAVQKRCFPAFRGSPSRDRWSRYRAEVRPRSAAPPWSPPRPPWSNGPPLRARATRPRPGCSPSRPASTAAGRCSPSPTPVPRRSAGTPRRTPDGSGSAATRGPWSPGSGSP